MSTVCGPADPDREPVGRPPAIPSSSFLTFPPSRSDHARRNQRLESTSASASSAGSSSSATTATGGGSSSLLALPGLGRVVDEQRVERQRVGQDEVADVVAADRDRVEVRAGRVRGRVAERHLDGLEVGVHLGVDG